MRKNPALLTVLVGASVALLACGQRGPLYLPSQAPAQATAAPPPTAATAHTAPNAAADAKKNPAPTAQQP